MRKTIIAGNWKMNLLFDDARKLFHELMNLSYDDKQTMVMIAPPALYLSQLGIANSSELQIAAQNCHQEEKGAFTGEWSAAMLQSVGIKHCIVGHSERRAMYGDTDEVVRDKVQQCVSHGIVPILCCGERLEEREEGNHFDRISTQVDSVLAVMDEREVRQMIIAYEPVWAIGTGRTASAAQAQEMHEFIRKLVKLRFDEQVASAVHILYGGSMKPENARELLAQGDVDGGLIGGASLSFDSFRAIISEA